MGEIVNLRRARKDRDRRFREDKAQENRIAFGRTKAERELTAAQKDLEAARLEAHRRETPDDQA
ncbi:DUF4169 family protein [Methylocystis sp. WRRC1]|uniref:DUF4169 family protein n=1 Tax=Methylocystis sp. WRRC1 TaxID=1732014 RepID=UPI001D15A4D0|nr:DUF4169 family protein [Methylocystis sp. WRRC1]MCC3245961.1 DUF4169 family protein [Methylocystis sp. WRRC1]